MEYNSETHPKLLIEHMEDGNSFVSFCSKYKISRATAYRWIDKHAEFKEAKEVGDRHSQSWWEDLGKKLASQGNSAVYIFNMKNRFGWTDRRGLEVAGTIEHRRTDPPKIAPFDASEDVIELKPLRRDE